MRRDLAALGAGLVVVGAALSLSADGGAVGWAPVTPTVLASLGLLVALVGAAVTAGTGDDGVTAGGGGSAGDDGTAGGGGTAGGSGTAAPRAPSADADLLGADFDATLARVEAMSAVELRSDDAVGALREPLREAAIAVVASREGVDRETAAARVERGEWTDDPVAAAFLSSSVRAPPSVRWREYWSTTPRAASRARRTAAVLEGSL